MKTRPLIKEIKVSLIYAEYALANNNDKDAERHLTNIYNYLHFGTYLLTPEQRKHKRPTEPKS